MRVKNMTASFKLRWSFKLYTTYLSRPSIAVPGPRIRGNRYIPCNQQNINGNKLILLSLKTGTTSERKPTGVRAQGFQLRLNSHRIVTRSNLTERPQILGRQIASTGKSRTPGTRNIGPLFSHKTMPSPAPNMPHSFRSTNDLLVIIPDDGIDVEAESQFYEDLCDDQTSLPPALAKSPQRTPSVFSRDIWLDDNSGASQAFSRNVHISGWTSVGDKLGGAYVVYDCVIRTKEDTTIHAHKRYSEFVQLYDALKHSLPTHQHHFIPPLPQKSPFSRYRATFLDRRRKQLQYWLSAVLLHPEIGACQAVRWWVMN